MSLPSQYKIITFKYLKRTRKDMKNTPNDEAVQQPLGREIYDYLREAGVNVKGVKITGKRNQNAFISLPYDRRLLEGDEQPYATETHEEQTMRLSKDQRLANEILRGFGFSRKKAYIDQTHQRYRINYTHNPNID